MGSAQHVCLACICTCVEHVRCLGLFKQCAYSPSTVARFMQPEVSICCVYICSKVLLQGPVPNGIAQDGTAGSANCCYCARLAHFLTTATRMSFLLPNGRTTHPSVYQTRRTSVYCIIHDLQPLAQIRNEPSLVLAPSACLLEQSGYGNPIDAHHEQSLQQP